MPKGGEQGLKRGEYVRISTVYFTFLKIFSIKKRKMKGNEGFIDITSN